MGYHKIISLAVATLLIVLLFGCGSVIRKTELAVYQLAYKPGEKIVASYEETDKSHNCEKNQRIFLEHSSLSPFKVAPGEQLLNRFIYASCYTKGVPGVIVRRVIYKGEVILEDETDYEFVPGTWAVAAYLKIPRDADPGAYIFEMDLKSGQQLIKKTFPFQILGR